MSTTGGLSAGAIASVALAAAFGTLFSVLSVGGAAEARTAYSLTPVGSTAVTVEYGANWSFEYRLSDSFHPNASRLSIFTVRIAGRSTPYLSKASDWAGDRKLTFSNWEGSAAPLPVGTYSFSVAHLATASSDQYGKSTAPVTLTVVPAKLSTSVDIDTDPNNPSHAILSATGTGDFLERAAESANADFTDPRVATIPAGTWKFSVKDSTGAVVHTAQVRSKTNASPVVTDYWTDVPRASTFDATAQFTPDQSVAARFTSVTSTAVSYTSPAGDPGETAPTADPAAAAPVPDKNIGLVVPIWLIVVWALVVLALAGVLVRFLFRRVGEPTAQEVTDETA